MRLGYKLGDDSGRWFNYPHNDVADKLLTRGEQQYALECVDLTTGLAVMEFFAMFQNWNAVESNFFDNKLFASACHQTFC